MTYSVLYRDEDLIVVDKGPGLAVQSRSMREKDLTDMLLLELKNESAKKSAAGGAEETQLPNNTGRARAAVQPAKGAGRTGTQAGDLPYLGVVHRLDQPVRGLVVFARNEKSAADLSAQAAGREMEKEYLARVHVLRPEALPRPGEERLIEHDLIRDGKTNRSSVCPKGTGGAKHAALILSLAGPEDGASEPAGESAPEPAGESAPEPAGESAQEPAKEGTPAGPRDTALVRIRLLTGRHHQIRVQLAAEGLPIVGDRKYGPAAEQVSSGPGETLPGYPLLCARRLSFRHPRTGERMCFTSRLQFTA